MFSDGQFHQIMKFEILNQTYVALSCAVVASGYAVDISLGAKGGAAAVGSDAVIHGG